MTSAEPEVSKGRKFNAVWTIPLIALALGAWMVVQTYLTEGPEIEVSFKTATGLKEGETQVRYRNIAVGTVTQIDISNDLESVVVKIKMDREAEPYLREDTLFWVVRARIGKGGISGLDTLLSGAYIEISPGREGAEQRRFVGLEQPPLTPTDAPGIRLVLLSEDSSSLSSGDSVVYKGFDVGQIESVEFDIETGDIRHTVFIDAPYDDLITSATRFWDVSGVTIATDAEGIKIRTGSLDTILHGGVSFGLPEDREPGKPVEPNTEFQLYSSYEEVLNQPFINKTYFVVEFKQSLRGLQPDAPVEYRGVRIGRVERFLVDELIDKTLREGLESVGTALPVLISLEPAQLHVPDTKEWAERMHDGVEYGVGRGLRASLGTTSLLTGVKFIDLEYYEDLPPVKMHEFEGYAVIPAIETSVGSIEHKASLFLDKLNELPLKDTVVNANQVLADLDRTLLSLQAILDDRHTRALPAEIDAAIESLRAILDDEELRTLPAELQNTLAAAKVQLEGDSTEVYQLGRTLHEVEAAARALREFLDFLEMNPESLIKGKSQQGEP